MKTYAAGILLFCSGILLAGVHISELSGPVKEAGELEIVTEQPVPVVDFAAKELQRFLEIAAGRKVPIVKKASAGKTSLILGDCPGVRAAGIEVGKIPDEGFRIVRKGNRIFIVGKDDPKRDPGRMEYTQYYRRATLSGVYDFLERFAGVRFFFPGPHGTVVPRKNGLFLPEKIDVTESPDMLARQYYFGVPKPYENFTRARLHTLESLRLRLSESHTVFSHGLAKLNLIERFGKTHPEYFALRDDGKRHCDPKMIFPGQPCFNSGIREEIYQDVKAYFTGRPATERGMKFWWNAVADGNYFCLSPQDMMYWCRCEKCRKIFDAKNGYTLKGKKAVSDFMFRFFVGIADRLTKEGIKGTIVLSVYPPLDQVPDCHIPENMLLKICVNGTVEKHRPDVDRMIRDWGKKAGSKLQSWTYAMGKHMSKVIPNLPQMMPKEAAKFITTYRDCLDGVFWEAETDVYLFNYLNFYITSKMMWNTSLDVDALLDDHYSVMFGKGGPMIREVFGELEKCWSSIVTNTTMGSLGPGVRVPGSWKLWGEIYSTETMIRYKDLFAQAGRAAADDPAAVDRIRFIWQNVMEPLYQEQRKFAEAQYAPDSWRTYCPGTVFLRPARGEVNEVNTRVDISRENGSLVFRFDCEEPRMNELAAALSGRDDPSIRKDSTVEIFLDPSGSRKTFYHFAVNANGALTDSRCRPDRKPDPGWNSSAAVKTEKGPAGWKAEIRIPLKDLGPLAEAMPVNFVRHRVLNGNSPVGEPDYQWSPQPSPVRRLLPIGKWGTLSPGKMPEILVPDGDFAKLKNTLQSTPEWKNPANLDSRTQSCALDNRIFISGGQSLYYKSTVRRPVTSYLTFPGIKPKTRYQLSYFVRTKDIKGSGGAGAILSFIDSRKRGSATLPYIKLTGTNPWHRLTFEFTTPDRDEIRKSGPPKVGLTLFAATGEVWFDKVEIVELK